MDTIGAVARIPHGGRRKSRFGENLKRLRQAAGISQEEVAARAGMSRPAITEIETGGAPNPRSETMQKIARALGKPLSEFARALEPDKEMAAAVKAYEASPYAQIDKPTGEELDRLKMASVVQWIDHRPNEESIHHILLADRASRRD